jgi:DNA modification methylase
MQELRVNTIYVGHALKWLKKLASGSVHCIVTSPPYYGLRDYGVNGQIGLEKTPQAYIRKLVLLFRECRRVLRDDGVMWVNIGDSYASGPRNRTPEQANANSTLPGSLKSQEQSLKQINKVAGELKPKDLMGIPWMLAFALRKDGWYLRQDIIWHKPNPMPESVSDRCTKSHEYIFLLSKSSKYYYDHEAIKQPMADSSFQRLSQDIDNQEGSERVPGKTNGKMKAVGQFVGGKKHKNVQDKGQAVNSFHATRNANGQEWQNEDGKANKRSVWTVVTKPFSEAHFATFPEDLIVDCIKAGSPEGGGNSGPFHGSRNNSGSGKETEQKFHRNRTEPGVRENSKQQIEKRTWNVFMRLFDALEIETEVKQTA